MAIVAATLAATAALLTARMLAQSSYGPFANGRLQTWTGRIEGRGFLAGLYARIAPGSPFALVSYATGAFALVSYATGMTRIRLRDFAAGTAIGASPRAFAYAALGGTLDDYSSPQALAALGVLIAMTIGGAALLWRARPRA